MFTNFYHRKFVAIGKDTAQNKLQSHLLKNAELRYIVKVKIRTFPEANSENLRER